MFSDGLDPACEDFWSDRVDLSIFSCLLDFILEEVADLDWELVHLVVLKLLERRGYLDELHTGGFYEGRHSIEVDISSHKSLDDGIGMIWHHNGRSCVECDFRERCIRD